MRSVFEQKNKELECLPRRSKRTNTFEEPAGLAFDNSDIHVEYAGSYEVGAHTVQSSGIADPLRRKVHAPVRRQSKRKKTQEPAPEDFEDAQLVKDTRIAREEDNELEGQKEGVGKYNVVGESGVQYKLRYHRKKKKVVAELDVTVEEAAWAVAADVAAVEEPSGVPQKAAHVLNNRQDGSVRDSNQDRSRLVVLSLRGLPRLFSITTGSLIMVCDGLQMSSII